jgi:hypothetical protein
MTEPVLPPTYQQPQWRPWTVGFRADRLPTRAGAIWQLSGLSIWLARWPAAANGISATSGLRSGKTSLLNGAMTIEHFSNGQYGSYGIVSTTGTCQDAGAWRVTWYQ